MPWSSTPARVSNGVSFRLQAQAPAVYLLASYLASSIAGPLGGAAWSTGRWSDVLALDGGLLAVAFLVALRLRAAPPRVLAAT